MLAKAAHIARQGFDDLLGRGLDFTHQPLGHQIDPAGVRGYYCDLRHKTFQRDSDWVIPRAQEALGHWERMLDGEPNRAPFLALADGLARDARPAAGGVGWYSPFGVPKYGLRPQWLSAMGQGETISVLLRAHDLTGERRYLQLARDAVAPMATAVADGGVANRIDGRLVLEEYPTPLPTGVLNGWIFALLGLHELVVVDGFPPARQVLEESLSALMALLASYDTGWWSLYSLACDPEPDLAKPFYQRLHPVMLRALNIARPDERLLLMATRWEAQFTGIAVVRVSANKLRYRARRELAGRRNREAPHLPPQPPAPPASQERIADRS